ncbi:MAG: DUF308 domain-containing protein [Ruminiclostridium sp.]|nr:DUF308 domain-containing protein [Ruminiclostridium sp.]
MNWFQRISKIITGVLLAIAGLLFILLDDEKYTLLLAGIIIYLLFCGIKMMIYYLTMARLMVGGKSILYKSVILLDLAVFTASFTSLSPLYLILYLVGIYIAAGVLDILRSLEAKKLDAPEWKIKFASGLFSILLGIAAGISGLLFNYPEISAFIYGGGLIWSGIAGIASAFRRTKSVYIQ